MTPSRSRMMSFWFMDVGFQAREFNVYELVGLALVRDNSGSIGP